MNKMHEISERLLDVGYRKQKFNKDNFLKNSNPENNDGFFRRLVEELGDERKATDFMVSCNTKILNDFIPEMSFEGNGFEISFFIEKNLVKIEALGERSCVESECGIITQEVIPYKEMKIDDFYELLIGKNFGMIFITGSGDN
jgi:hypothetical protein